MVVNAIEEARGKSQLMAFVITQSFFTSDDCNFILDHSAPEDYRNMIFILLDPTPSIQDQEGIIPSTKISIRVGRKIKFPGLVDMEEGIKWGDRKYSKFIQQVRRYLPPLPRQKSEVGREDNRVSIQEASQPLIGSNLDPDKQLTSNYDVDSSSDIEPDEHQPGFGSNTRNDVFIAPGIIQENAESMKPESFDSGLFSPGPQSDTNPFENMNPQQLSV